ncbi:MAG: UvrD-helicase domain-containing protein, partial [Clostridia bacterium]|nr:UvrD-helicase domain-containing protein [Clostridia bacterium]
MARIWTKAQSDAINALDGNVLVSAAAGSGKTA